MHVSKPTVVLGAACRLSRVFLRFYDWWCVFFNFRSRRVRMEGVSIREVHVSFSLCRFSCSFMGEVCEWSKWRNWRRHSTLQLHPAGSPHLNHIRLILYLLISESFHSASVWFTCSWKSCLNFSRMALLLLLSSPLDLSELKDSVHSKCNTIVPFKGRDINWEARDHEWTDPLNVFTLDVKDDIMCCGIVFLCPGWMLWLRQRRLTRSYWIIWDHDDAAQGSIAIVAGKNLLSLTLRCHSLSAAHFAWNKLNSSMLCLELLSFLSIILCPQAEFECINSKKKQKKKGYKNSGVVSVKSCQVGCSCL